MGVYQGKYLFIFWSKNHLETFKILENLGEKKNADWKLLLKISSQLMFSAPLKPSFLATVPSAVSAKVYKIFFV